jgi:hypothetical protein
MNNARMNHTPRDTHKAALIDGGFGWLMGILALVAPAGCDKSEPKKDTGQVAPSAVAAAPTVSAPAPPAPADINVNALGEDLKCPKSGPKQACRIIKEFAQSKRFTAQTPSGEGRWVGQAFIVEKGVEKQREIVLWAKRVPTSQVGPGDLPIKVGYEFFADELKSHAEKLVRALSHGEPPSPKNQAFPFVQKMVPSKQRVIVNTNDQSVHVTSEESIYIRAKAPRSVYLVNPANASGAGSGDGMYAELWLADW